MWYAMASFARVRRQRGHVARPPRGQGGYVASVPVLLLEEEDMFVFAGSVST